MLDDDRSTVRRRVRILLLCLALAIGLGAWHRSAVARGSNDPVTIVLRTLYSPLIRGARQVADSLSSLVSPIFRSRALEKENARLRRLNRRLTGEAAYLRDSAIRAQRLETLLGFVKTMPPRTLAARIVTLSLDGSPGQIVINRGSADGLKRGSVVVAPEGVVGQVYDMTPTTASVLAISDPRASVGARVQRSNGRTVGICRGVGARSLRMAYLSREADIRIGDTITTSGMGGKNGIYPPGLVIGAVRSVEEDLGSSGTAAIVSMAVRLDRLEEVAVLR